jgi:hypothetical protein
MDDTSFTLPPYLFVEQRCIRIQNPNGSSYHLSFGGPDDKFNPGKASG